MNMSNNILDLDVREDIKYKLDVNMLIEAGAGSGKTTSMTNRMVSLITSEKCRVENIAAITFTRKAAQELKERFQNKLEQSYQEEEDNQKKCAQSCVEQYGGVFYWYNSFLLCVNTARKAYRRLS